MVQYAAFKLIQNGGRLDRYIPSRIALRASHCGAFIHPKMSSVQGSTYTPPTTLVQHYTVMSIIIINFII